MTTGQSVLSIALLQNEVLFPKNVPRHGGSLGSPGGRVTDDFHARFLEMDGNKNGRNSQESQEGVLFTKTVTNV